MTVNPFLLALFNINEIFFLNQEQMVYSTIDENKCADDGTIKPSVSIIVTNSTMLCFVRVCLYVLFGHLLGKG